MKKPLNLFAVAVGLIILTIVVLAALLLFFNPSAKHVRRNPVMDNETASAPKPVFRKDGEVKFMDAGREKIKAAIDVEVADDEAKRTQGLMYRDSMPELSGMIFLFEVEEPQAFWMKNTIMPLDIIYVNADHQIVSIARNTKPFSLESIPSVKPTQYVVEVNAGFAQRHGIKEGDLIVF